MTPILSAWTRWSTPDESKAARRPKRVLVVEDELVTGECAAEALMDAGYAVLFAASAEEAEVLLQKEQIDVLFTDVDLGGRNGFELARRALVLQPALSVVFASGRSRRFVGDPVLAHSAFLQKPYRLEDMLKEIDFALAPSAFQ